MNETKTTINDAESVSKTNSKVSSIKKSFGNKRRKKILKIIIGIIIVLIVIVGIGLKFGLFERFAGKNLLQEESLTTYTVSRRTITQSLTSSGTLEPNDSYTITPLVSGEILADFFEEGDIVEEDQLLYKVDSSNIESSIKRARNSVKNVQKSLDNAIKEREKLSIKSDYSGVIEKLYVEIGDEISAGAKIADVIDKDTMLIDIPFIAIDASTFYPGQEATLTFPSYETATGIIKEIKAATSVNELGVVTRIVTISVSNMGGITTSTSAYASVGGATCTAPATFYYNDEGQIVSKISGTVENIHYNEGSKISKDMVIVTLSSEDIEDRIETLELNLEDAQTSLDDTLDNYDNYNITSPISGTVISKDYKAGDTLGNGSGNSGSASMAVIYDMTAFKFTMNIDELDIDKIKLYQDVIITSDARSGKEYHGTVTNISIQGSTSNGTTVYPVTVTIENVEDEGRRVVDEDGTIHKYYKTGKTGTIKSHTLENVSGNIYNYSDGVVIERFSDSATTEILRRDGKNMALKADGTYMLGSDTYTFSNGMNSLLLETVDESEMLRPGMNIDAEILVQNVENVIAVPVSAIMRGYKVRVISRADESTRDDEKTVNSNGMPENAGGISAQRADSRENRGYGTVSLDTQYEEVTVTVGVTDNNYIEIIEGLNVGDVVILDQVNSIAVHNNTTQQMQGGGFYGVNGGGTGGFSGAPMMGAPTGAMGTMRPGGR